jgi:hypothetical protein
MAASALLGRVFGGESGLGVALEDVKVMHDFADFD